jgi:hypothetical protein
MSITDTVPRRCGQAALAPDLRNYVHTAFLIEKPHSAKVRHYESLDVQPVSLFSSRAVHAKSRFALGVLDKRTRQLRYAEVGSGSIIRMEPRSRGVNYGPTGTITEQAETAEARILQNKR